jgi:hypothetical protein
MYYRHKFLGVIYEVMDNFKLMNVKWDVVMYASGMPSYGIGQSVSHKYGGLSSIPVLLHEGFVVYKVALGQVS